MDLNINNVRKVEENITTFKNPLYRRALHRYNKLHTTLSISSLSALELITVSIFLKSYVVHILRPVKTIVCTLIDLNFILHNIYTPYVFMKLKKCHLKLHVKGMTWEHFCNFVSAQMYYMYIYH